MTLAVIRCDVSGGGCWDDYYETHLVTYFRFDFIRSGKRISNHVSDVDVAWRGAFVGSSASWYRSGIECEIRQVIN